MTKTKAFSVMATKLGGLKGFPILKGVELRKRFERYVVQFKKALEFYRGTGAGLTESEMRSGLTLEEKMNAQCPYFFRMNNIFGQQANVSPPALGSIGLEDDSPDSEPDRVDCMDSQVPQEPLPAARDDLPEESTIVGDEQAGPNEDGVYRNFDVELEDSHDKVEEMTVPPPTRVQPSKSGVSYARTKTVNEKMVLNRDSRQGLTKLYADAMQQKLEYRQQMMEFRHAALEEKRKMRESQEQAEEKKRLDQRREESLRRKQAAREENKRVRMTMFVEGMRNGKTIEEIQTMINLINGS